MWAYNVMLKCAVYGRVFNLPSAWQRSSILLRSAFSTAPLQKLFLSAQRPSVLALSCCPIQRQLLKKDLHVSNFLRSAVNTNLAKDIVLFKYDNVKLHKIITLFGCVNFAMFMTISLNIYTLLTKPKPGEGDVPSEFGSETIENSSVSSYSPAPIHPDPSKTSLSEDVSSTNESQGPISTSYILAALCGVTFVLGYAVLAGTWIYCNHVVRYIVLQKCGRKVTVITHGAFGKNRSHTWNLDEVNIRGNRAISSSVLLNAKNKFFSYILDIKGTYTNPKLFDSTVGIPRDFRK